MTERHQRRNGQGTDLPIRNLTAADQALLVVCWSRAYLLSDHDAWPSSMG